MNVAQRVLIAHTDPKVAARLLSAFQQRGWEVIVASDALQALSFVMKERPQAAVLSAQLPGGGGLFVLKRMKVSIHTAATPVIVIRVAGGPSRVEFKKAGAVECLEDPVDLELACEAVSRCFEQPTAPVQAPVEVVAAPERLAALRHTGLLDSEPEEIFDSLTRLAAKLLDVPVTLVSLVDQDRQFFKSQVGLPEPWATSRQTPLSHSFCQWVVSGQDELVVRDARSHTGLLPNLAIRDLGVVAYAGVPLATTGGHFIGSFCAIDSRPKDWSEDELLTLRELAALAEAFSNLENSRRRPRGMTDGQEPLDGNLAQVINAAIAAATALLQRCGSRMSGTEYAKLLGAVEQFSQKLEKPVRLAA